MKPQLFTITSETQCDLGSCEVSNIITYNSPLFSLRFIPTVSLVVGTSLKALEVTLSEGLSSLY